MRYLVAVFAAFGLVFVLLVAVSISGWYNVAASQPHSGLVSWVLDTIADRSIKRQAGNVTVSDLTRVSIESGFRHYEETCVICHAAPGVERSEIGKGLNPQAPDLHEEAEEFNDRELYWIVKNGIKMTGMPAFGQTHSEEELWAIVAFVRRLPDMTADDYRNFSAQFSGTASPHHRHGDAESHGP